MSDPGFDNEKYWANRKAEKAFREQWYEWRKEMKELYTPAYVASNVSDFTQRAFMHYLQIAAQMEAQQVANQAQLEELRAIAPELAPNLKSQSIDSEGTNMIVTNIDPDSINDIKL